jgi:metal-sulfur cluster biosynthetic enzyme
MAGEDWIRLTQAQHVHEVLHLLTGRTDPDIIPGLVAVGLIPRLEIGRDEEALPRLQVVRHAIDMELTFAFCDVVQQAVRAHPGSADLARHHFRFSDCRQIKPILMFGRHCRKFDLIHSLSSCYHL